MHSSNLKTSTQASSPGLEPVLPDGSPLFFLICVKGDDAGEAAVWLSGVSED
jgi:hypothetical protein